MTCKRRVAGRNDGMKSCASPGQIAVRIGDVVDVLVDVECCGVRESKREVRQLNAA